VLTFVCPSCRGTITVSRQAAGKRGACPRCRALVEAPSIDTRDSALLPAWGEAHREELDRARADPSRRFGRYLLLSELGRGGMGVVHRAWDESLGKEVALKVLEAKGPNAATLVRRFEREGEAIGKLRHPNIVTVHDAGEAQGKHYLAMELIEGRTLKARVAKDERRIGFLRSLEVVRDVTRAVAHAHERGVLHRDLKPENVILDANDHPYVVDFGLAKLEEGTILTKGDEAFGTPAYMCPEQANGEHTDERSDVYSLGAILYFVLCGHAPFEGKSTLTVITAVLTKKPVPPSRTNPRARGELEAICLRCLEKRPRHRYASAAALADELDRYLEGGAVEASAGRGPGGKLLAIVAILSVAGAALAFALSRREERRPAPPPKAPPAPSSARPHAGNANVETAASWLERGNALREKKDLAGALAAYTRAVELDPGFYDALSMRGVTRRLAGDLSGAIADHTRAIELDGARSAGWSERALARFDSGDRQGAIADATRSTEVAPQDARLWSNRAVMYYATGDLEHAVSDLTRSLDLDPGVVSSWVSRSGIRKLLKDRDGALADAERAVELDPKNAPAWRARADAHRARGERDAALDDATRALELDPKDPVSWAIRASLRYWRGEFDGTIDDATHALALDPKNASALADRGMSLRAKGQLDEALADLTRAVELEPETAMYWNSHAVVSFERKDMAGAIASATRAVKADPTCVDAWSTRAAARATNGDLEGAVADISRALELEPTKAAVWCNRAGIRHAAKDDRGALSDITRAIELDPSSPDSWFNRAVIRRDLGDREGALADVKHYLEIAPGDRNYGQAKALLAELER
jgi:serine/threonine-protein kinase